MQELTKLDAARAQLDRALLLFLDEKDYLSSLTLGGAAEEIFLQLFRERGVEAAGDSLVSLAVYVGEADGLVKVRPGEYRYMMNYALNSAKHYDYPDGEKTVLVDERETASVLNRAITDCLKLSPECSESMKRFYALVL